jgi:DNA-directed RNA polymerase, mitochondrial
MRKELIADLANRIEVEIADRSTLKFLKTTRVEDYIDVVISVVYLYTRTKRGKHNHTIYMTEVICAIGHAVRNHLKLKRDSAVAAKVGAFILYSFQSLGMLRVILGSGSKGHNAFVIGIDNDEDICSLWDTIKPHAIEKLPSETPYAPWTSVKHETGIMLVKTNNKEVFEKLSPETHPIVFDVVNKAQAVGWQINKRVYKIQLWGFRNKIDAFKDIWSLSNLEARATKMREAKAVSDMAKKFLDKTFYHLYSFDFRGRKYPSTAYLHEQGSDVARGLLLRADKKVIGQTGFFWLMVSIANNWGGDAGREDGLKTDKIPLTNRYAWAVDNEEILLSYAENPKVNQGWMSADKPWQFLAACFELAQLRIWQYHNGKGDKPYQDYSYKSSLEVYIDGSNNGSQHLAALTRDETTAPHVNLVPSEFPGDLYRYVAEHVWMRLEVIVSEMSKETIQACHKVIDELIDLKKQINEAEPRSERRKDLISKIQSFKDKNKDVIDIAAPVYWWRITDMKYKRKILKRNVMTLPYGGTAYGLGEQQILDARKHGIELLHHMEHRWGAYLGREVFADCRISLKRPMQLLKVFENAGKLAEMEDEFLSWTVPITNFPVTQNYTQGRVKKIWVQYGPPVGEKLNTGYYINTLQLAISFLEDPIPSKGKQSQGASPNAIHSLDAAHLALTVHRAPFPISTVHDSYGCLLADMPALYQLVRETFVELYETDPLTSLMKDIGGDTSKIEFGTLDIRLILQSEYAFA